MSVTPDFIGQIYKDTNTGNLWRANSLTPGDWTLELQNMDVSWTPLSVDFWALFQYLTYYGLPGVTNLTFRGDSYRQGFDLETCPDLLTISFPNLLTIDPTSSVGGYLYIFDCAALTTFNAPLLTDVPADDVTITGNILLTSIDLSSLQTVGDDLNIAANPSLITVDFGSVSTIGNRLLMQDCTLLTTVDISSLTALGGNLTANGCAFSASTVNAILAQLVSIPTYGAGKTVNLSGGTSAAPAGQGIADAATLTGRGATVITN